MRSGLFTTVALVLAVVAGPAGSADATVGNGELAVIRQHATLLSVDPSSGAVGTIASKAYAPAWSPNGAQIAYDQLVGNTLQIFVANANGSNPVQLTSASAPSSDPAWSPDGTRIAFARDTGSDTSNLFLMSSTGANQTQLTPTTLDEEGSPSWSPDGTRIVFTRAIAKPLSGGGIQYNAEIFVLNVATLHATRLTHNRAFDGNPAWSPDGTQIAFLSDRLKPGLEGPTQLFAMDTDGSGITRLTHERTGVETPVWAPDGSELAFVSGKSRLERMLPTVGSAPVCLLDNVTPGDGLAWQQTATTTPSAQPASTLGVHIKHTAYVGMVLHARPGCWAGSMPLALSYQWSRCLAGTCRPITGATKPSYGVQPDDEGDEVEVTEQASNPFGSGSTSSRTKPIAG